MHKKSTISGGFVLAEFLIALSIAGFLMAGISGLLNSALNTENNTRLNLETIQEARFAMQRIVNSLSQSRRLMIPLAENTNTAYSESIRNILAVTLSPNLDRDKDGWADANNDRDFMDVNNNGIRDAGEPERIDEDMPQDVTNDGLQGIGGIDDNGNGVADENGNSTDADEDGIQAEDPIDGIDNDGDGSIDEDPGVDMNGDSKPGIKNVDDDFDGTVDEGNNDDDDEDGLRGEDWLDIVVYYLDDTTLMERMPKLNPVNGSDYSAYPLAENVSQFRIERIMGGNGEAVLVDITLTLAPPNSFPFTLNTRVGVGASL